MRGRWMSRGWLLAGCKHSGGVGAYCSAFGVGSYLFYDSITSLLSTFVWDYRSSKQRDTLYLCLGTWMVHIRRNTEARKTTLQSFQYHILSGAHMYIY